MQRSLITLQVLVGEFRDGHILGIFGSSDVSCGDHYILLLIGSIE